MQSLALTSVPFSVYSSFQLCLSSLEVFCRVRRDLQKPGLHNCTQPDTSLRSGWRSTYIWILAYCVSSAATTIPCVYTILVIPNAETATTIGTLALSSAQKRFLLYNYLPFLAFPLIAAVDSGLQLAEDVKFAVTARKALEKKAQ